MKGVRSMKKQYVKPELYFEDFELSTTVATGCSIIVDHAVTDCTIDIPGIGKIFITDSCMRREVADNDKICYNVPFDSNKLFSS